MPDQFYLDMEKNRESLSRKDLNEVVNIGDYYFSRYKAYHKDSDLKKANEAYQRAVNLSNANSPNVHIYTKKLKDAQELLLALYTPV